MPQQISTANPFVELLSASVVASESSDYYNVADCRLFSVAAFSAGSVSVSIQVSLEPAAPVHWAELTTVTGNAAGGVKQIDGIFKWLRVVRDGTTTSVTVQLLKGLRNVVQ